MRWFLWPGVLKEVMSSGQLLSRIWEINQRKWDDHRRIIVNCSTEYFGFFGQEHREETFLNTMDRGRQYTNDSFSGKKTKNSRSCSMRCAKAPMCRICVYGTYMKAHRAKRGCGGKPKQPVGMRRRGRSAQMHAVVDGWGIVLRLTGGEVHDSAMKNRRAASPAWSIWRRASFGCIMSLVSDCRNRLWHGQSGSFDEAAQHEDDIK